MHKSVPPSLREGGFDRVRRPGTCAPAGPAERLVSRLWVGILLFSAATGWGWGRPHARPSWVDERLSGLLAPQMRFRAHRLANEAPLRGGFSLETSRSWAKGWDPLGTSSAPVLRRLPRVVGPAQLELDAVPRRRGSFRGDEGHPWSLAGSRASGTSRRKGRAGAVAAGEMPPPARRVARRHFARLRLGGGAPAPKSETARARVLPAAARRPGDGPPEDDGRAPGPPPVRGARHGTPSPEGQVALARADAHAGPPARRLALAAGRPRPPWPAPAAKRTFTSGARARSAAGLGAGPGVRRKAKGLVHTVDLDDRGASNDMRDTRASPEMTDSDLVGPSSSTPARAPEGGRVRTTGA